MQGTWFRSLVRDNIPLTVKQLSLCATIKTRHSQKKKKKQLFRITYVKKHIYVQSSIIQNGQDAEAM